MIRCRYCNEKIDILGHECSKKQIGYASWRTRKNRRSKTEQREHPNTKFNKKPKKK